MEYSFCFGSLLEGYGWFDTHGSGSGGAAARRADDSNLQGHLQSRPVSRHREHRKLQGIFQR
ncbi:protein of unknown function [Candidatus Nitrosacidococcus tergens]|uniref:Uncharacterized protein n=1 Tax=Candidatus Nitrosacidococcus tergens TaxID=553981 RepID=A0A7G1Q9Y7_9GAMM|nr:protein of unknown function [Candidatus Nitrosacidococcus tergens]